MKRDTEDLKNTKRFDPPKCPSAIAFCGNPENSVEMVNTYGTYNIQPTADTQNEFPAIAAGNPPTAQKSLEFVKDKRRDSAR